MAWALVLVVVIGVGLPMAAWSITRRRPSARQAVNRRGAGYDSIDRWLLDQYQLPPHERWRVREAVFAGRQVNDATLARAARLVLTPGGEDVPPALTAYVDKVALHAHTVTDADVVALQRAGNSDDALFEVTVAAALGAALGRLERGLAALRGEEPD